MFTGAEGMPDDEPDDEEFGTRRVVKADSIQLALRLRAGPKAGRKSLVSPTASDKRNLEREDVEAFEEKYFEEQQRVLEDLDLQPLEVKREIAEELAMSLTWKDVSFSTRVFDPENPKVKNDAVILELCSGNVEPGSLVAIMGPSGCGKSTLLDILAQKKTSKYSGDIYVNGHSICGDPLLRRFAAYVGQEDHMPQHLTTREVVAFNAHLKKASSSRISKAQFQADLDTLLFDVGLLHVADTKIGGDKVRGLSGGQKRRVSLARALASGPQLLFCDEPTSGLSSTDAELCIKSLKRLAEIRGTTILVVIHQPRIEIAQLFSHLILMTSRPGRIVYDGPMAAVAEHLEKIGCPVPAGANYMDYALDLVTPGIPQAAPDLFRSHYLENMLPAIQAACDKALQSPGKTILELLKRDLQLQLETKDVPVIRKSQFGVSFITQMQVLLARQIRLLIVDPTALGQILVMVIEGCVFGCIYFGVGDKEPQGMSQIAFLFIVLSVLTMLPIMTMPALFEQRLIMKLETSEKLYSESAYTIAFLCVSMTVSMIGVLLMMTISFALAQMPWSSFGIFLYWGVLIFMMMDAIVGFVAAATSNAEQANLCLLPLQIVITLFNGFLLTKVSCPAYLKWVFHIAPLSYAMEDMAHFTWGQEPKAWGILVVYNGYDWNESTPVVGTALVIALILLGRLAQYLALKYLQKVQK